MIPPYSWLLPYRNPKIEFLHQAIESLVNQTLRGQIVLVDHENEDEHVRDLTYALDDGQNIRVVRASGLTFAGALNAGLATCDGDIVLRLDSDDIAEPRRGEYQVARMQHEPDLDLLCSHGHWIDEGGIPMADATLTPLTHRAICEALPKRCVIYHPSVALRKEKVLAVGGYPTNFPFAEDYALWATLLENSGTFECDRRKLVRLRRHPTQRTLEKVEKQHLSTERIKRWLAYRL